MTYKEFREWCKENDWRIVEDDEHIYIKLESGLTRARIRKKSSNKVFIETADIPLIEKALELAKTPLEKREEQKKYYVVVNGLIPELDKYINKQNHAEKLFLSNKIECPSSQTKFTKAEAEEIMEQLSFEMVEVEDE